MIKDKVILHYVKNIHKFRQALPKDKTEKNLQGS